MTMMKSYKQNVRDEGPSVFSRLANVAVTPCASIIITGSSDTLVEFLFSSTGVSGKMSMVLLWLTWKCQTKCWASSLLQLSNNTMYLFMCVFSDCEVHAKSKHLYGSIDFSADDFIAASMVQLNKCYNVIHVVGCITCQTCPLSSLLEFVWLTVCLIRWVLVCLFDVVCLIDWMIVTNLQLHACLSDCSSVSFWVWRFSDESSKISGEILEVNWYDVQ